jgi:DNA-binding YbaB/EbfC family protein
MTKKGLSGLASQAGMLRKLQGLQKDLRKAQKEIDAMTITATAAGGAVTAVVSGNRRLQSIIIQPEVVNPDGVERLQDLIVAAVNQGLEQLEKEVADKMNAATGGLGLDLGLG